MAHKLNITSGESIPDLLWNAVDKNPFNDDTIVKIKDNVSNQGAAVTSIPSPFAQMHLFETAFKFINQGIKDNGGSEKEFLTSTSTYHKIVSQCLDLYELLFGYQTLGLTQKIHLNIWKHEELDALEKFDDLGQKTFASTLKNYIQNYNQESNRFSGSQPFNQFTIIRHEHQVIGASSPLTGFFTIDEKVPKDIQKPDASFFFDSPQALFTREEKFQKFINWFFESNPLAVKAFPSVYQYIKTNRAFTKNSNLTLFTAAIESNDLDKDQEPQTEVLTIKNTPLFLLFNALPYQCEKIGDHSETLTHSDYAIRSRKKLERPPLVLIPNSKMRSWTFYSGPMPTNINPNEFNTEDIEKRKIPNFEVSYPWFGKNDFLAPHIVQINDYPINNKKFWVPKDENCQNVLPPILPNYFNYFTMEDLEENLSIERLPQNSIVVRLKIPVKAENETGAVFFERIYSEVDPNSVDSDDKGAIITESFGLSIYPFFRVSDNSYNDFYKIGQFYNKSIKSLQTNFYRQNLTEPSSIQISRNLEFERTRNNEGQRYRTKYTELATFSKDKTKTENKGTSEDIRFDIMEIQLTLNEPENLLIKCVIIPNWGNEIMLSEKGYIAFDVGTSNTYVACSRENRIPLALNTATEEDQKLFPQLVFLHQPSSSKNGSNKYDFNGENIQNFVSPQLSELMPSIIGELDSTFTFPMRTIINQDNDTNPNEIEELSNLININIPFGIEYSALRSKFDKSFSHLKWGIAKKDEAAPRNRLHMFIDQVAFLGRNKLLSMGVKPSETELIWFKPLSMNIDIISVFRGIWHQTYDKYFASESSGKRLINEITESWAPFFSHTRSYGSGKSYLNIDIGGGTSDVLMFRDNSPVLTSSFRFAGDHLFEDGLNEQADSNDRNGIVQKYQRIACDFFAEDTTKLDIIGFMENSVNLRSADMMMFFFKQNEINRVIRLDGHLQLIFLLHHTALFFHAAQLIKINNNPLPEKIGISGNGSKLMMITNRDEDLNRTFGLANIVSKIFNFIFESEEDELIELEVLKNAKEATAHGGIKGLPSIKDKSDLDQQNFQFGLGDANTLIHGNDGKTKKKYKYSDFLEDNNENLQAVVENVSRFLEFFFEELWYSCDFVKNFGLDRGFSQERCKSVCLKRKNIEGALRQAIQDKQHIESQIELHETMFFYPIRAIIYDLSLLMANDNGLEQLQN